MPRAALPSCPQAAQEREAAAAARLRPLEEQLSRLRADYDNFRRRAQDEAARTSTTARADVAKQARASPHARTRALRGLRWQRCTPRVRGAAR